MKQLRPDQPRKMAKHDVNTMFETGKRELFHNMQSVLIVKKTENQKCLCIDEAIGKIDKKCPNCMGEGTIPVIKRCRGYVMDPQSQMKNATLGSLRDFGWMKENALTFHLMPEVRPKKGDLIVVCEFDNNDIPYKKGIQFYEVNSVQDKRDENGETAYYLASGIMEETNNRFKYFEIVKRAGEIVYIPVISGDN